MPPTPRPATPVVVGPGPATSPRRSRHGAGPAGAALSLLLARACDSSRLVERETAFDRVFRGEGLMPLGLEALEQMRLGWELIGRYRWPRRAWLARQRDLRSGSATVELTVDARGPVSGEGP